MFCIIINFSLETFTSSSIRFLEMEFPGKLSYGPLCFFGILEFLLSKIFKNNIFLLNIFKRGSHKNSS